MNCACLAGQLPRPGEDGTLRDWTIAPDALCPRDFPDPQIPVIPKTAHNG